MKEIVDIPEWFVLWIEEEKAENKTNSQIAYGLSIAIYTNKMNYEQAYWVIQHLDLCYRLILKIN